MEVQRIIASEGLLDNIRKMGDVLGNLLRTHISPMHYVGEVRGRGLFWAVEFMKNPRTQVPFSADAQFCNRVINRALDLGLNILGNLGTTVMWSMLSYRHLTWYRKRSCVKWLLSSKQLLRRSAHDFMRRRWEPPGILTRLTQLPLSLDCN